MTQTAATATAQTTTEYVGRRRSGGYATGNYEGRHQYEAPRPTDAEIAAQVARLMSLPGKFDA